MIEYERNSPIILSGPSASGKSYMARRIEDEYAVTRVLPVTTRSPRPSEVPGVDSVFINDEAFEEGVHRDEIILPSGHLGAYYGYSAHQVESIYAEERIPLLEVYSPKIEKVLGHFATSRTVFLRPASTDFLEDRMLERGQNLEEIQRRMEAVNEELAFFEGGGRNFYNYIYEVGPNSSSVLHRKIISDLGISDPDSLPPTMPSPQDIAEAYSRAAPEYENARANWDNEALLDSLCSRLPPGSRVLDVGCGSGTPIAEGLVDRGMHVHGIDISEGQINRALSKQIENATFEVKNMLDIDYENEFDGIACFYSIYHIEREHHEEMMTKLAKSLKKDGLVMVLFGVKARAGHVGEIAGASVGWSSHDMKTNLELMEGVGLVIQNVFIDNAGDERHQVVVAKK